MKKILLTAMASFLFIAFAMQGLCFAAAHDEKSVDKNLGRQSNLIDKQAKTPEGEKRIESWIKNKFNVSDKQISDLRAQRLGYGEIVILQTLAQKTGKSITELLAERKSGTGWGKIARNNNLNLGNLVSDVRKSTKAVESTVKKSGNGKEMPMERKGSAAASKQTGETKGDKGFGGPGGMGGSSGMKGRGH